MADEPVGTADDDTQNDPTEGASAASEPSASVPTQTESQSFINPADLPPELKEIYSRMHRSYLKERDKFKGFKDKADVVDKFWGDPDFAKQSIQQWAQQQGIAISFGGPAAETRQASATTGSTSGVPQELIAAIEAELPQELRWMARPLAASTWKAQGSLIAPLMQKTQQKEASARQAEYESLAEDLSETAPGWESHEDDMNELLDFLRGSDLRHKRWGSKLQVLHGIVTGGAVATREAVRRIGEAGRNRTSTGVAGRSTTTNIEERVRGAKNDQEAWKIAAEHAIDTLRKSGAAVPS